MKLYFAPGACSLAVHITLHELNVPSELAQVDIATHTLGDGSDYLAISPRGYVPLLELDDETRHTEVAAWANYLSIPLTAYPNIQAYLVRISCRPAVLKALRVEGLHK